MGTVLHVNGYTQSTQFSAFTCYTLGTAEALRKAQNLEKTSQWKARTNTVCSQATFCSFLT